jgi:hypothetical protein
MQNNITDVHSGNSKYNVDFDFIVNFLQIIVLQESEKIVIEKGCFLSPFYLSISNSFLLILIQSYV